MSQIFRNVVSVRRGLTELIGRLTSDNARKTPTFIFLGAGSTQSESLEETLRLPLALSLRNKLLKSYYNRVTIDQCLQEFTKETKINEPSPDQVWQVLIRKPSLLRQYDEELHDAFSPDKPIPAAYHMVARWFFTPDVNVGGVATTNFDIQFSRAFKNVASSMNISPRDFDVAELPQDFRYFQDCRRSPEEIVQRLHGSLSKPWSIVAGSKEVISDVSHCLLDYDRSTSPNPFKLLRTVIDALDPIPDGSRKTSFYPYVYLQDSLSLSNTIIIIGYSFQDRELSRVIEKACSRGKEIYLVDPHPSPDIRRRAPFLEQASLVKVTAECFLEAFTSGLAQPTEAMRVRPALIQLPKMERDVLREGPKYIPGYPHARLISSPSSAEETSFFDPIYGTFQFSPSVANAALGIIDTGEVQRLRQIKQLSFVHLKYQGATHDRFSHSIGVAHLADVVMTYWRGAGRNASPNILNEGDHAAFVTSCLIHDIGHGPFGHTMDMVRSKLINTGDHEEDTERIFRQIFSKDTFADLDKALHDLEISNTKVNAILRKSRDKAKPDQQFDPLRFLLDNSGCDLDRLDFVMRDTAYALMNWSNTTPVIRKHFENLISNHHKILHGIRIRPENTQYTVVFDKSAEDALRSFAFLYLHLYNEVYCCWQNVAAQTMLAEAVVEMLKSRKVEFDDIKPLTDVELLAKLEEFENPKVAELAYLVKYRRLFELHTTIEIGSNWKDEFLLPDRDLIKKYVGSSACEFTLVGRIPSKKVQVNITSIGDPSPREGKLFGEKYAGVDLGSTPAKIMFFKPPC